MVEKPNQSVKVTGLAISVGTERLLVARKQYSGHRWALLESLVVNSTFTEYALCEVLRNNETVFIERLGWTSAMTIKYALPPIFVLLNGVIEIYITSGGAGRTYTAALEGKYASP